jgi:hypothetical protein
LQRAVPALEEDHSVVSAFVDDNRQYSKPIDIGAPLTELYLKFSVVHLLTQLSLIGVNCNFPLWSQLQ